MSRNRRLKYTVRNLAEVKDATKLYNILLNNILEKYPTNDKRRVQQARNYLLNLIINYRSNNSILESNIVRGVCAEVMFEVLVRHYKNIEPNILVMKNLLIPLKDGGTTQLDFILLTPTRLIIVEVKSIFGAIDIKDGVVTSEWKDYNKKKQVREAKPWSQNLLHIMSLKEFLGVNNIFMENVVFLFGAGKVRSSKLIEGQHLMIYENHANLFKYLLNGNQNTIPQSVMSTLVRKLIPTIPTDKESAGHITYLQKKHK